MKATNTRRARILASTLWLLAPALAASPAKGAPTACPNALALGWTCTSANATVKFDTGAVIGGNTMPSTLSFDSTVFQLTSILFTNDGTQTDNFFNLTLAVKNVGATAWNGMLITISDADTNSNDPGTIGVTTHPFAAHLHRGVLANTWNNATSDFACVAYSGFGCIGPGLYDMFLIQNGAAIAQNDTLDGSTLRVHDKGATMSFLMTFTPVPEPTTAFLVATGLMALGLARRHLSA